MPTERRRPFLSAQSPRVVLEDEPDRDDSRETVDGGDDSACLFCTLIDEVRDEIEEINGDGAAEELDQEDDALRDKLALALSYGALAYAAGHGVATCDDCNKAIDKALREVKTELRGARRAARRRRSSVRG